MADPATTPAAPTSAPPPRSGLVNSAIRRPVGTLALASVVFILGLFFVDRLPIDLLPQVEFPLVRVTVNYPGVAPEVMEEQVTRVLERSLAATENLVSIDSRASEGRTNVNLRFAYGTNLDVALQDASRYLELARTRLPPDIDPPRLYKFDPAQDPVWLAGFTSTLRSEVDVHDWLQNELAPHIIAIEGVSSVEAAGGMVRELEVIADQDRLRSYNLGIGDVAAALAAENVDVAGGWMTSNAFDVMTKTDGLLRSPAEFADLLIPLPGSTERIRLGEVAEVRDGHREQRLFVRLGDTPATQLAAYKLPQANTVAVADEINATIERLARSGFIPADIRFEAISDQSFFIRGALASVASAALIGGALAMLLVLLFLGSLRKSFIIGLSIPIALMATFALMGVSGLTLNIISLGGLALGVGLLLDNAIVMLENIYRHREQLGKSAEDAAHDGAREVASAIAAGTFTNLAAVLPLLLISGLAALIFRDLIYTISFAIIATLLAALTVVPMLAALLGNLRFDSGLVHSAPLRAFNRGLDAVRRGYRRLLPRILRGRWFVVAGAALALYGALQLAGTLGTEFLPQVDDGGVSVRMALPRGAPPEETDTAARAVEDVIAAMPHVASRFTLVGGHLGGGVVNERPGTMNMRVQLVPRAERPDMSAGVWVAEAQARLDQLDLPGARISVRPPSIRGMRFTTSGDDFSVMVVGGDDLQTLQNLARDITARIADVPGLEGVEVGRDEQSPLFRIRIDRDRAASLGLRVSEVGRAVRDAVDGMVPTRFVTGIQEYDVRVRLAPEQVADAQALGNLLLRRADGGTPVLLRDVARFDLGAGPAHIERENQSRVQRVTGNVNTAVADVGTVLGEAQARLADLPLPDGYSLVFAGQWETIDETNRELGTVVGLALFLVFVVLAVQYERLSNPLVILVAAPLALIGVVAALALTSTPLSAPVLIGVILLVGIVVNNAILLVEYIEQGRARGLSVSRAVVAAGGVRLRPILMTTLTTVLGMLPLALGLGQGAEIMRPLALTVVGGLLGAMLLTLLVVPCVYLIIDAAAASLRRVLVGAPAARSRALGQRRADDPVAGPAR